MMPKKAGAVVSVHTAGHTAHSQTNHLTAVRHPVLCATHRATYSIVKSATSALSTPNQTAGLMEWNSGTVSRTVTTAETAMRAVMKTCMRKAAGEEVG